MRKIIIVSFLLLFALVQVQAQTSEESKKGPVITFEETSHDFGDMYQGDKVEYNFKYTNTGTEPLLVSEVVTTCGCTASKWSKEPVLPGKGGELTVTFNSANKMGRQNKVITVLSNSNTPARVSIVANILPPKSAAEKK